VDFSIIKFYKSGNWKQEIQVRGAPLRVHLFDDVFVT